MTSPPLAPAHAKMPSVNRQTAPPRPLEAVVFDCDGLLLDTETHWSTAETTLFARYGKTFGRDHKVRMIGSSMQAAGEILEELLEQPGRASQINDEMLELVEEAMMASEPMPGAADLVGELRGRVPVALASNSWRRLITVALHAADLTDSFDVVVCGDEVARPKPAPDIYLETARLLGAAPERTIALEDSPNGVRSARAAGMFVVGIPSFEGIELPEAHIVADSLKADDVRRALDLL
jgi:HAD superfamily hydrolase (TIGR01509 family)